MYPTLKAILAKLQGALKVSIDQTTPGTTNKVVAEISGSNIPKEQPVPIIKSPVKSITTIIDAVSIAPGGADTGYVNLGLNGTEDEVWLAVNIDKQPWTLFPKNIFGGGSSAAGYPGYSGSTVVFTNSQLPALSLLLGYAGANLQGMPAPGSFAEAKNSRLPYDSGMSVRVINAHATDIATVTVKVIRVWR